MTIYNPDDMPPDPDLADVPVELRNAQTIGDVGGDNAAMPILVVVPELHGHARRRREGFYDDNENTDGDTA